MFVKLNKIASMFVAGKVNILFFINLFSFRSAILGSYITEQQFLEKEGVFLLLDLLEVLEKLMHRNKNKSKFI